MRSAAEMFEMPKPSSPSLFFRAACLLVRCWSTAAPLADEPATGRITPAPQLPASLPWDLAALSEPPAEIAADGTLAAPRPPAAVRGFFFTVATPAGLQVSSPAVIVPER